MSTYKLVTRDVNSGIKVVLKYKSWYAVTDKLLAIGSGKVYAGSKLVQEL